MPRGVETPLGPLPLWAQEAKIGASMINARGETVATKPSFRTAFKRRRCLIPADGFYEWQKQADSKTKIPHYIRMAKDRAFAFAGLWETWRGADGLAIDSCTIVTTEANELMRPLHDRMPVILPEEHFAQRLDPKKGEAAELASLLKPYPPAEMTAFPISTLVNSPRNECPECILRASA